MHCPNGCLYYSSHKVALWIKLFMVSAIIFRRHTLHCFAFNLKYPRPRYEYTAPNSKYIEAECPLQIEVPPPPPPHQRKKNKLNKKNKTILPSYQPCEMKFKTRNTCSSKKMVALWNSRTVKQSSDLTTNPIPHRYHWKSNCQICHLWLFVDIVRLPCAIFSKIILIKKGQHWSIFMRKHEKKRFSLTMYLDHPQYWSDLARVVFIVLIWLQLWIIKATEKLGFLHVGYWGPAGTNYIWHVLDRGVS